MKESGIIMTGNHPRLILDGIKTMTRRTRGLEEINKAPATWQYVWDSICQQHRFYDTYYKDAPPVIVKCPYGQVGDRLWVREAYLYDPIVEGGIVYKADNPEIPNIVKWKPSLFMFRKDSRILLEITEVRVERLQEITFADIEAEGHKPFAYPDGMQELSSAEAYSWFINLWDSLNAKRKVSWNTDMGTISGRGYSWEDNPWVWVISFRRVEDAR